MRAHKKDQAETTCFPRIRWVRKRISKGGFNGRDKNGKTRKEEIKSHQLKKAK